MSGSQYRRNLTLADLLAGQGSEAPVAPAAPQANYLSSDQGGMPPNERNRLLEILMQPDDVGPPPEIDEGTTGTRIGSGILAGLGDALGTYGAILGGGRAPNYMQQLQEKREFDKARKQNYAQRKAGAETDAKRRTAEYLIGQDDAKLDAMAKRAAEQKADRLLQEKITREANEVAADQAFQLKKQAEEHRLAREEQESGFRHQKGMAELEARLKSGNDPKTEQHLKSFALGAKIANGFVRGIPDENVRPLVERLAGDESDPSNIIPPETPEQIRREHEDEMTAAGIFGPPRDLSRDYFNERLIRAYREVQKRLNPQPTP